MIWVAIRSYFAGVLTVVLGGTLAAIFVPEMEGWVGENTPKQ
jgi:hypothetical protein